MQNKKQGAEVCKAGGSCHMSIWLVSFFIFVFPPPKTANFRQFFHVGSSRCGQK